METKEEKKAPKTPLTDAERASKYRQRQKLLKEGIVVTSLLEDAKNKLKAIDDPNVTDLQQMEEFRNKLSLDDWKVLAIFIKNRKQRTKQEGAALDQGRQIEASIQEKIQKIANYEFAELQKVLSIPHPQPERQKIILGKLDENLFLFMDYMKNNEPPYTDFLRDVVETHGLIEASNFIKLFVIVCMRYEGQELQITRQMAEQAMATLISGLPNIQASFGLLRLLFHNLIDLADFPPDLLLKFQGRYDQTISSFIKSITKVKRSVIDLLPSTIFIFSMPILRCLKSGADILHKQIPLDFLPLTIEIVCYSFCQDQTEFEEFMQTFKRGCLAHFELLRETDFINILYYINNRAIDRTPGFFGSLGKATQAIQRSFELVGESKIDKFDPELTERVVNGGHEQFQLIKAQPKVLMAYNQKNLQKLAKEIIQRNEGIDWSTIDLESELTVEEIRPFKLLKMSKLLEIQHLALRISNSQLASDRLYVCYQTGKGKTALCLGLALLKLEKFQKVFVVNESRDLLFRDFKRANQSWAHEGIAPILLDEANIKHRVEKGVYFIHSELLMRALKDSKILGMEGSFFIFDEFDSFLLHPKSQFAELATIMRGIKHLIAFTGSDLQRHHVKFIQEECCGTVVNMNSRFIEDGLILQDKCEVHSLIKQYRCRIVEIAREKAQSVPVVIILNVGTEILTASLQKAMISVFNLSTMDASFVESTMRVFTTMNSSMYSVFIINDEQGRGLDFQTTNQIEKHGGIYLIIAQLPNYYLQFRQYIGRTGRIGNKGQYSVILYEKESKNVDGQVHLQQRLEKLKNDDILVFQKQHSGVEDAPMSQVQLAEKQVDEEARTLTQNTFSIHEELACGECMAPSELIGNEKEEEVKHDLEPIQVPSKHYFSDDSYPMHRGGPTHQLRRETKFKDKLFVRSSKRLNQMSKQLSEIDLGYFESYSSPLIHQEMLADKVRSEAYEKALLLTCSQLTVADVGTGSGYLAIKAAQAGATHVYAIEFCDIVKTALQNVKSQGLDQKITIIKDLAEDAILPVEKVDVIVSEWMGYLLICESMFSSVLSLRKRYLSEGGKMIPSSGKILVQSGSQMTQMSSYLPASRIKAIPKRYKWPAMALGWCLTHSPSSNAISASVRHGIIPSLQNLISELLRAEL